MAVTRHSIFLHPVYRMMDQLKEAIAFSALNPHDKHVDVLLKSSAICREMGAVTAILCKSGTSFKMLCM